MTAGGFLGAVLARQRYDYASRAWTHGNITSAISAGAGAGLLCAMGDFTASVTVSGNLSRILVRGNMSSSTLLLSDGNLSVLQVLGSVESSSMNVCGQLGVIAVGRDFWNTSVDAGSLRAVRVRGQIGEDDTDGDADEIRARDGRFWVRDADEWAWIDGTSSSCLGNVSCVVGAP